jgi:hypothetical protein
MIYHFRAISNESDDFILDIAIDSKLRFIDLHNFIQEVLKFDTTQITSFFVTDEDWNKEQEITLVDMMEVDGPHVMDAVQIEELITKRKQRLLYAFDLFAERVLFMELTQIDGGTLNHPICTRKDGTPPIQFLDPLELEEIDIENLIENENDDDDFSGMDSGFPEDLPDEDFNPDDYY